jgi:hypothetical protein
LQEKKKTPSSALEVTVILFMPIKCPTKSNGVID